MRATVVLTPSESKKLISKAIAKKKEVEIAMNTAYVILFEGTTNTFVAKELFGIDLDCSNFTSGMNISGVLCNSDRAIRGKFPLVAYKGKLIDMPYEQAISDFHKDTVIIKGGNAIDRDGFNIPGHWDFCFPGNPYNLPYRFGKNYIFCTIRSEIYRRKIV
jgi:hypothetical protein